MVARLEPGLTMATGVSLCSGSVAGHGKPGPSGVRLLVYSGGDGWLDAAWCGQCPRTWLLFLEGPMARAARSFRLLSPEPRATWTGPQVPPAGPVPFHGEQLALLAGLGDARLKVGPITLIIDGSIQRFTGWPSRQYHAP